MSFNNRNPNPSSGLCNLLYLFLFLLDTNSLSFNFSSFDGSNPVVVLQGNASISQSQIDLTVNQIDTPVTGSMGRALYPTPIQLWKQDGSTKNLTDFTTQFTFSITEASSTSFGDGLTFCLLPINTGLLGDAYGGRLGLYNISDTDFTFANNTSIVAVEFDTYRNPWDPSSDHIGIDVNSVKSKAYVNVSVGLKNQTGQASISYHSTTKNLSVSFIVEQTSTPYVVSLSYTIDLSTILPEIVQIGFSASTGSNVELHKILDWSFNSTLEATVSPTPAPVPIRSRRNRHGQEEQESNIEATQFDIDDDFDKEAGPKRFALLYLHEEWEQSVVHRDIKCSNVMLDLNFNPKLGDFGLAWLTDHDTGLQTTAVAGTPGYLAPYKASKESDVYSFGIAALEIVCGRKVIKVKEEASKVNLPGWVWDLYGKGLVLEAVDNRLEGEFDERQAECLMIVGLWCSHPDASCRPTIKQAIATLNFETHLPSLPSQLPVPVYVSPSINMSLYSSYVSTNTLKGSYAYTSGSSINSLSFNFTSFNQNNPIVTLQGDASISNSQIQLTKNQIDTTVIASYGRALHPEPVQLWDANTKKMTNFTTNFIFSTAQATSNSYGDGLTFILVPNNTQIPPDSYGRCLALFSNLGNTTRCALNQTIVAVEFDTFKNGFDPSANHIGIDVNSIESVAYVNVTVGLKNITGHAFISYDSTAKNLSVSLTVEQTSTPYVVSLSYTIDLSTILPEIVQVGFSASTGTSVELHKILDWSFSSTLEAAVSPSPAPTPTVTGSSNKTGLVAGISVGLFLFLIIGLFIVWRIILRKKSLGEDQDGEIEATQLRHRNLVQLLGWCHDRGELLLVYEFMPNRSLDSHLFNPKLDFLPWETRYKIARGLSSALSYLHEEWEQSVVHRDIKCSNVMLDLNFNPKLGDFGLARLTDHDAGLQTTAVAGTPGYLAPECLLTGKFSKESDVYSFGIAALEIACGRKIIEVKEEKGKVNLAEWVWDLYGKGIIVEAVDYRLEGEFDERQAECLMIVGLWCSHPDASCRPSIKQAITTLNFETPLPSLPPQLPVPVYLSPGMSFFSSYVPSNKTEGSYAYTSGSSINTSTTKSSLESTSNTHPLLGEKQ
ncbi:hypothetical protein V2J09_022678 [Rumex salicifolius]